jgi:hypothetical protein
MALNFSDDEMSVLVGLCGPIAQQARPSFLQEVAQELEAAGLGGGVGAVHRIGRVVQRRYFNPPEFPNQSAPVHRGSTRAA